MVVIKWLLIAIAVAAVAMLVAARFGLFQGRTPADLGVREGRLKPPSKTPNSVSSQAAALHPEHPMRAYADIAPLPLAGGGAATIARIRSIAEEMPGARLIAGEPDYLYVQFTTRLMRYVDDAEFWFDPAAQVVHVRSSSRVGRKDFGVNRARIEAIRTRLAAAG